MKSPEEIIGNVPVAMVLNGQESTWRPGILLGKCAVEALDAAGYVIVPKEPTRAMLLDGINAFEEADYDGDMMKEFDDVWSVMITAAQTKESPPTS